MTHGREPPAKGRGGWHRATGLLGPWCRFILENRVIAKQIESLVDDIYALFRDGCHPNEDLVEQFARQLAETVATRLESYGKPREPTLRMSNLGRGDRQLWYELRSDLASEDLAPHTKLKFLYGDIIEAVLLFLAKCAGHEVKYEQEEVRLNDIVGHNDAVIDGVMVDVKSASSHAFKKFKTGALLEDDPFGYIEQITGYTKALNLERAAFLAMDKQNGHITLFEVPSDVLDGVKIEERIEHIREVLDKDEPPDRCYEPVPFGKSGNETLGINCSYCPFKFECWKDANEGLGLRTFLYSDGPQHFVKIEKEPKVHEITF